MLIWRRWMVIRWNNDIYPPYLDFISRFIETLKNEQSFVYSANFEGLFLLGIIPIFVRQISDWEL
jgi:hypothetical protein